MANFTVVLDQPGEIHPAAKECLDSFASTSVPETFEEGELLTLLEGADAVMSWGNTKFTPELFARIGSNVKTIAITGTGVDNIDLDSAKEKGIRVTNTPGMNANAVAEFSIGAILTCQRMLYGAIETTRQQRWSEAEAFTGREIKESVAGVVGLGNIGRRVAALLKAFGATVVGFDPVVTEEQAKEWGITLERDLPSLCEMVDFLSVHVPLNEHTERMVNVACFERMKPHAWIVNAGRAPVVDEDSLLPYLRQKRIGGYFTDVFPAEPADFSRELYGLENVYCTPHIAAMTDAAYRDMQLYAAKNIEAVLTGKEPLNTVV